jgi:YbgC/YbaW family acyl-CoA thioester hydrolase
MTETIRRGRLIVRKLLIEPEFHQVDIMGMVHNAVYFHWFEKGRLVILWQILPFDEAIRLRLGLPVVRHVCDYRKAARYGDRLMLTTTHELLPRYEGRLVFKHSLMHETNKAEIAEAETTLTIMDMQSGQLIREFPPEVWQRYQSLT